MIASRGTGSSGHRTVVHHHAPSMSRVAAPIAIPARMASPVLVPAAALHSVFGRLRQVLLAHLLVVLEAAGGEHHAASRVDRPERAVALARALRPRGPVLQR